MAKFYGALEVAQLEWFTNAGKPSASSNQFRVIWVSDTKVVQVSDGTQWVTVGGGGGGGTLYWVEAANSPTSNFVNNILTYDFEATLGQQLYAFMRVPNSYTPGNPISLRETFYSTDTSGNVLFQTVATLIRPGTDLISSTTNQRTSTNSAVTLSGATASKPQSVVFDLTSTTGQINSVAVSAGDLILIQLIRNVSDTATGVATIPPFGADINFI